ncbi:hypothetical protein CDD82_5865 [Ophiocordyceps australis]|uniref:RING-type domain-containing protein n=1 Tax=Ophiocordyceps australis TaxID=1399860 RepID=A0A2C5YYR9_9HYPO|nr:hypothetical protein CDD82_5865 [Ophiocordyceps australis]
MSHSKRNTSRPVFTSHERALAKSNWAASSARLNRDSYLAFGSCSLCLSTAVEPVACQRGDVFCRECALSNILAQKKELKHALKVHREAEAEAQRIKVSEEDEICKRAIYDFELTQAGLEVRHKAVTNDAPSTSTPKPSSAVVLATSTKRKMTLDKDETGAITESDRAKIRREMDVERAAKLTLPSFWTPGVLDNKPSQGSDKTKVNGPVCPASSTDGPHTISMQKLLTIQFSQAASEATSTKSNICPACLKTLSNSTSPVMLQPCGHVLCMSCANQFLIAFNSRPSDSEPETPILCYVCDTPVSRKGSKTNNGSGSLPSGFIPLRSEGTGFSARGASTVRKSGIAFQC